MSITYSSRVVNFSVKMFVTAFLLVAGIPIGGCKVDLDLSGSLRANYFQSSKDLDDIEHFSGVTLQLKNQLRFSRQAAFVLEGRIGDSAINHAGYSTSKLQQAYFQYRAASYDLTIGKQIIAWGKADGLNPTDIISPRDYRVLLPFDEDQREGVMSIKGDYFFDNEIAVSLISIIEHQASSIPLMQMDGYQYLFDNNRTGSEDVDISDPQWALRMSQSSGALDWSIYLFDGYSLLPEAYELNVTNDINEIKLSYPAMQMLGFDFAGAFDRFSYRMEMATYWLNEQGKVTNQATENSGMVPHTYLVAGLERAFGQEFKLNFQYVGRRTKGVNIASGSELSLSVNKATSVSNETSVNNEILQQSYLAHSADPSVLTNFNQMIISLPDKYNNGFTFRMSDAWFYQTLKAELFINHHFVDASRFYLFKLEYDVNDHLGVTLGAHKYHGNEDSLFGSLKKNDNAFVEFRYSF